ncbi:MAG: hypothetical protein WC928_00015 [Patescibacteria group bacterium]|jgi:hypothetical protein
MGYKSETESIRIAHSEATHYILTGLNVAIHVRGGSWLIAQIFIDLITARKQADVLKCWLGTVSHFKRLVKEGDYNISNIVDRCWDLKEDPEYFFGSLIALRNSAIKKEGDSIFNYLLIENDIEHLTLQRDANILSNWFSFFINSVEHYDDPTQNVVNILLQLKDDSFEEYQRLESLIIDYYKQKGLEANKDNGDLKIKTKNGYISFILTPEATNRKYVYFFMNEVTYQR